MSMQRKFIALSIGAAVSGLLFACASNPEQPPTETQHPPLVVDNYGTPTAEELYAARFPAGVTQINADGKRRFVYCDDGCPGATPKTPIADLNAEVARRAQANLRARRDTANRQPIVRAETTSAPPATASAVVTPVTASMAGSAVATGVASASAPALSAAVIPASTNKPTKPSVVSFATPGGVDATEHSSAADTEAPGTADRQAEATDTERKELATDSSVATEVPVEVDHAEPAASTAPVDTTGDLHEHDAEKELNATAMSEPMDVVTFMAGSAWLHPRSEANLKELAEAWIAVDDIGTTEPRPLLIAGFTDSSPTKNASFNEYLARRRAEVVREALLRYGVPEDSVQVIAHVMCCYVADNSTADGRARNRRAEIHVL